MAALRRGGTALPSASVVPLVLIVGCPTEFVATCREAGRRYAVAVRECDLGSLRTVVAGGRPYVIIVSEDVYQFDPQAFDAIARQAAASLVRIEGKDVSEHEVRHLLVDAIVESAATGPGSGVRLAVR